MPAEKVDLKLLDAFALDFSGNEGLAGAARCVASDDALDALISALVARAAERGLTIGAPPELRNQASREGWIHLPLEGSLATLAD